jgi:mitogen-activated protein kinase kinase
MMERHNRKSHLVGPLSPGTKALLRGEETPSTAGSGSTYDRTPTSGDIPISSASSNGSIPSARPYPTRTSSQQGAVSNIGQGAQMNLPIRQGRPPSSRGAPDQRAAPKPGYVQ